MSLFIRSLFLSLIVFLLHILMFLLVPGNTENGGYYGGLGAIVFYFLFGYWGYFFLSGTYIYISKKDVQRKVRYAKGFFIVVLGYLFFRIPDIIDNVFFRNFNLATFLFFLILIPILVEFEFILRKRFRNSMIVD